MDQFAEAFARAWFKLTHATWRLARESIHEVRPSERFGRRRLGPSASYVGPTGGVR
jgi:catalase (peroxidase I)